MSKLAFWSYLCLNLIGWIAIYTIEVRSARVNKIPGNNSRYEQERWRLIEERYKNLLLIIWLIITPIIVCALYGINLCFIPKSTAKVGHIIFPSMATWMFPGLFIGLTLAMLFINYRISVTMTERDRADFKSYQQSNRKIDSERFTKRISVVVISLSLLLIVVWMNVYICAGLDGIQFKTGFPWSQKQYRFADISRIYRKSARFDQNTKTQTKYNCYVIFSDGFILNFNKEYFFVSENKRTKFLEYLSKMSQVPIIDEQ